MNRPTFVPRINFLITSITEVGFTGGGGGGSTVQGRGRGIYNAGVGRGGGVYSAVATKASSQDASKYN